MSENEQEKDQNDDSGDQSSENEDPLTPEDLQPGEDNPLAEPLDDDEARDDLDVLGGKTPEESEQSEQSEQTEQSDPDGSDSDDQDGESRSSSAT